MQMMETNAKFNLFLDHLIAQGLQITLPSKVNYVENCVGSKHSSNSTSKTVNFVDTSGKVVQTQGTPVSNTSKTRMQQKEKVTKVNSREKEKGTKVNSVEKENGTNGKG